MEDMCYERLRAMCVCVFYYCRTYYKTVRVGEGIVEDGTREEPGTLTQGSPRPIAQRTLYAN